MQLASQIDIAATNYDHVGVHIPPHEELNAFELLDAGQGSFLNEIPPGSFMTSHGNTFAAPELPGQNLGFEFLSGHGLELSSDGTSTKDNASCLDTTSERHSPGYSDDRTVSKPNHDLPDVNLMEHLIDVFFIHYPDFTRMFESSARELKNSILLPPSHALYPHPGLLHAICGAASIYTDKVPPTRLPFYGRAPAHQLFPDAVKQLFNLPDSFGEHHCHLALKRLRTTKGSRMGFQIDAVQALIILSTTLRRFAKWAGSHGTTDGAIKLASLIHLNVSPGFESLAREYVPAVRLLPANSLKEEEARRNTFWICYVSERFHARMPSYPMGIDDEDISQPLPLRYDILERGIPIPDSERQYIHSPDLLINHPIQITDSFVMMVKGAILLSRARTFNRRFRKLNFLTDLGTDCMTSPPVDQENVSDSTERAKRADARQTEHFRKLGQEVDSFTRSFPAYLQEPIMQDGSVDNSLLNAYLACYVAKILLHEPHADFRLNELGSEEQDFSCRSARKVIEALEAALQILRKMIECVTDISLSDPFCTSILYQCGATCLDVIQTSFARSPITEEMISEQPRARKYWEKFQFTKSVLQKIGSRLQQAEVSALLLDDMARRVMNPGRRSARVLVD